MDDAEEELEMAEDPFLEAGIEIPTNLPSYVNKSSKAMYHQGSNATIGPASSTNLSRSPSVRSALLTKFQVSM